MKTSTALCGKVEPIAAMRSEAYLLIKGRMTMAKTTKEQPKTATTNVVIKAPNFQRAELKLVGTAPYGSNRMGQKARNEMMRKQMLGDQAKKERKREPKDFDLLYREALHVSTEGWYGAPASAFRTALVDACRTVGFKMVMAKLCLFVEPEGFDKNDSQPLVRIHGEPHRVDMTVTLATGVPDILPRPVFDKWHMKLKLKWDADQFSAGDVVNLLAHVGERVGIGAGRPFSKNSCGLGWGTFRVEA